MVSKESVITQIEKLGFNHHGWGRAEILELPHILLPDEMIYELVNGTYEGGFALAVATDIRVILIDKKPMNYLTVEDIRFDMISEIDYSHRLFGANIRISTGVKDLKFRSYNQARLRKLISHVQHRMAEAKRQASQNQVGQNNHLERLNSQLQAYLKAQSDYQKRLEKEKNALQDASKSATLPPAPVPSHELSDYLFARSLLGQYEAQTGKKVQASLDGNGLQMLDGSTSKTQPMSEQELKDIWAAGISEVFGNGEKADRAQHHSFEINPVSVAFSRLPMVIRSRRFSQQVSQLTSENYAATG
jgi:hypothetical protein